MVIRSRLCIYLRVLGELDSGRHTLGATLRTSVRASVFPVVKSTSPGLLRDTAGEPYYTPCYKGYTCSPVRVHTHAWVLRAGSKSLC